MSNKNGHFGHIDDFMPVRRSLSDILKSKNAAMEPRAVKVLKVFSSLHLIRYRLVSAALQRDLDAMGDKTQSVWLDRDYPTKVARYGIFDNELGVPLAVLTVFSEKGRGPELTFVTLSPDHSIPAAQFIEILNELDFPPSIDMGTDQEMIQKCDLWYEEGSWFHREPVFAVKVTFERISFQTRPGLKETVDVLIPEIEGKPLHGNGDASRADDNAYSHKMYAIDELGKLGYGIRPGFSSWDGKCVKRVKILHKELMSAVFDAPDQEVSLMPR